jgi:hypothetical protein
MQKGIQAVEKGRRISMLRGKAEGYHYPGCVERKDIQAEGEGKRIPIRGPQF